MLLRSEVVEEDLGYVARGSLKAALRRLRDDPTCGKPLGEALQGCRSIRVEGSENRIVYREGEGANGPTVEVIAIGRRREDAVYETATKRVAAQNAENGESAKRSKKSSSKKSSAKGRNKRSRRGRR